MIGVCVREREGEVSGESILCFQKVGLGVWFRGRSMVMAVVSGTG